jgi:hypothetical protein
MKRLLTVLFSLVALASHAQCGFGLEAGANFSDYNMTEIKSGMRIGAFCDMRLSDKCYFQPGIYYVANGYKANLLKGYEQYNLNTIEVPLNIEYRIGTLFSNTLFIGAGPYFAFYGDGSYTIDAKPIYSKRALRLGNGATDDMRRFDFGCGVNLGYEIAEVLFVRARAQMGISDLLPSGWQNSSANSMGGSLSVGGYIFRSRVCGRRIINENKDK